MLIALLLAGCALHLVGGLAAWLGGRRVFGLATGCALLGSAGLATAAVGSLAGVQCSTLLLPWGVPGGGIAIGLDALSAVFLLPIALLGGLVALYARGYWDAEASAGRTRAAVGLLVAGMALVVTARHGLWFLLCWEAMALAAWAAMSAEHRTREVRVAGWTYLVFTHLGTACLIAMVVALGTRFGGLAWEPSGSAAHALDGTIVVLAILGFGAKAGLLPLHAWLPAAHAGAPSHVSALLSGVMLKTGIYGILRVTGLLPEPAAWWGLLLLIIGGATALYGISSALFQNDGKRLLACSSIENLGLIALAVGLALHARATGHDTIAALALSAALLHVWHHSVFKGLLFLGAGAVLHATGTRRLDRLGGLLQRMPRVGALMLLGGAAAAGLPGLAGFASEWPLYLAAFADLRGGGWAGTVAVLVLALCGGAAVAVYSALIGGAFLGSARSPDAAHAHDPERSMLIPMLLLGGMCLALALALPFTLRAVAPAVVGWTGVPAEAPSAWLLAVAGAGLALVLLVLWRLLHVRLARAPGGRAPTWDCGYAAPEARMQYTPRSFTDPLGGVMPLLVRPARTVQGAVGLFPAVARLGIGQGDGVLDRLYRPFAGWIAGRCQRLRLLQQGYLSIYQLYILIITVALLAVALLGGQSG